MRILVLLTDLFDAVGGIQSFNRSLSKALNDIGATNSWEVKILVLNQDKSNDFCKRYFSKDIVECKGFGKNKILFATQAIRETVSVDSVIFGHVNLIPLALIFNIFKKDIKQYLCVFGIEVYRKLNLLQQNGLKKIDKILSICEYTKNEMSKYSLVDENKFFIFPCTLDPLFLQECNGKADECLRETQSKKLILIVSQLNKMDRYKKIDMIIEAMSLVFEEDNNSMFVIVGEGDDRSRLENLVSKMGLGDRVRFTGAVSNKELIEYYKACDIFVSFNPGIVFLEAMFFGKPCIGVRQGQAVEIINEGKTGLLYKPDDVNDLSKCILNLLKDENQRRELGKNSKQFYEEKFSFDRFRDRLESVLKSEK